MHKKKEEFNSKPGQERKNSGDEKCRPETDVDERVLGDQIRRIFHIPSWTD
jgi:hypothetical protein